MAKENRKKRINNDDFDEQIQDYRKLRNTIVRTSIESSMNKINLKFKNKSQKEFSDAIEKNQITICVGDSGVGKSYISIAKAFELYMNKDNGFDKIFIITPIVESEDQVGFLKGSLLDKMDPYLYSIYYLMDKIIGEENRKKLVENDIIKPLCMSYIRGINIDHSILIADETQNMTISGIKTLLTRIGYSSKFILSGDLNQIDRFKNDSSSGLKYAYNNLKDIEGIGFIEFKKEDIVRNPIISDILNRFK